MKTLSIQITRSAIRRYKINQLDLSYPHTSWCDLVTLSRLGLWRSTSCFAQYDCVHFTDWGEIGPVHEKTIKKRDWSIHSYMKNIFTNQFFRKSPESPKTHFHHLRNNLFLSFYPPISFYCASPFLSFAKIKKHTTMLVTECEIDESYLYLAGMQKVIQNQ